MTRTFLTAALTLGLGVFAPVAEAQWQCGAWDRNQQIIRCTTAGAEDAYAGLSVALVGNLAVNFTVWSVLSQQCIPGTTPVGTLIGTFLADLQSGDSELFAFQDAASRMLDGGCLDIFIFDCTLRSNGQPSACFSDLSATAAPFK